MPFSLAHLSSLISRRSDFAAKRALSFGKAFLLTAATLLTLGSHAPAGPDPSDPEDGRHHWAFQPLHTDEISRVPLLALSHNRVDDFIHQRLEENGLSPAEEIDGRTLARRLFVQLWGLPPSPEDLHLLSPERPMTYPEKQAMVDRLLASPRFGERWGRHWLDLARYADSNGLDENFLFREAWRYRNWVIQAINRDLPFNRFVLEQIAGDLLPYDSLEQRDRQRIAAGFLVIGPKVLLGNDPQNQRLEVADEQIDTIGSTLLGLTVACARCHDHKFEPIPTADYYSLAGIFTSTEVMEQRYMLGEQRVMERLVGLGPDGDRLDAEYEKYWREATDRKAALEHARAALEHLEKGDSAALQSLLTQQPAALAEGARDETLPVDARLQAQRSLVTQREQEATAPPIPPRAMIPADAEKPSDEAIRLAGQFDRQAEVVPRGFLQVLKQPETPAPPIAPETSGRLELARWLTDPEHGAGILSARVTANRLWHHLFGQGLVKTVDNFGRTGELPSHPLLLDYLAHQLLTSEGSLKSLIREMVLSRTFALAIPCEDAEPPSDGGEGSRAEAIDPENRLLWRGHRRRLDPESLRDSILAAAGELDLAWRDSTVWYLGDQATAVGKNENRRRTDFPCRSVYLPVIRNDLPEIFQAFDFADPHATTGRRPETLSATQGLFLLNDPMVMDVARKLAERLLQPDDSCPEPALDRLFLRTLGSLPHPEERAALKTFISSTADRLTAQGQPDAELQAWTLACHAVFSLSRFQFLE